VLTETPLLITIAAKVYLERKRLPERRAQLYQEFVDIWLDEARERGLRDELDAALLDLAQPALAHLAMAMTEHPDWTDEKSLIPVVAEYLDEQLNLKARAPAVAERFLRVMARRSGVFLKREERYEWVHPTFREYFAALALNQQLESRKSFEDVLGERVMQDEWEETIVALAEMCIMPVELVKWLSAQVVKKKHSHAAFLVKKCWESSDAAASDEVRATVVQALCVSLRDPDAFLRWEAAQELGNIGDHHAVKPLMAALRDPSAGVRRGVAEALGKIGAPAVKPLIVALRDPDEGVRWGAAEALGKIGDTRAVKPLIAALCDRNLDVRRSAIVALGCIGDSRAVKPLIASLRDTDLEVSVLAAEALVKIGVPAVEPLIAALRDPNNIEDVRRRAALALVGIGVPVVEPLITALRYPDKNVRWYAAMVLGEIGAPTTVESLIAALGDPDLEVFALAGRALVKIGAPSVEPLIAALRYPNESIRERAAVVLGQIGAPAVEPLIAALRDPDASVRWYEVEALGRTGDARALPELERVAQEDTGKTPWGESVADAAREAIARIRERMEKTD